MLSQKILVIGASGYVGSRLVLQLIERGYKVKAAGRSLQKLELRPWAGHSAVELVQVDVLDKNSLVKICDGCFAAYYLVHSMNGPAKDFSKMDRCAAHNMVWAAEYAGLERIIYLGGLGENERQLSKHLLSRLEVGKILSSGRTPVTILRAAMIIGAGSASFEIMRYLVNRLPVMITPRWVSTESQPIAIRNVLNYLAGCLSVPETIGKIFDIGGNEIFSYRCLMQTYAQEARLPKRVIIALPVLTPRLSAYWIHLITPLNAALAEPLIEGLRNRMVCTENNIRELIPQKLLTCREAIGAALERNQSEDFIPEAVFPGDPTWSTTN